MLPLRPTAPHLLRALGGRSLRSLYTKLPNNHHIYAFPTSATSTTYHLSLLPTDPPTPALCLGTTYDLPPTPQSFTPNRDFLLLLNDVLRRHAHEDPAVQAQAQSFISAQASPLLHAPRRRGERRVEPAGGWVHVSDTRKAPEWARIAEPEDIFGSVEVDAAGTVRPESFQESGTYRMVTNEGVLGLSEYLRGRLVERLKEVEGQIRGGGKVEHTNARHESQRYKGEPR